MSTLDDQFNMKLRGSLLVIVCCLVMEICNINRKEYVLFNAGLSNRVVSLSGLGLLFLLYPLVGHLTDVYLTRYRSLKCSFVMLVILACLGTFGVAMEIEIERRSWLIYEGVKGFLILVSLVLFSCVSRRYRYRQRDEIVNVQAMIEDTHERWLDQEEEYLQEQRAFFQSLSLYAS